MRRFAWAVLALGLGCGKSAPKHLQDLSNLHFVVSSQDKWCELDVTYDQVCGVNSVKLKVEVDGLPLGSAVETPDPASGCSIGMSFSCNSTPDPGLASSTFFVSDGTSTGQVKVDHLMAVRKLALIQPADGIIHPGNPMVLEVQPSATLSSTAQVTFTNAADSHSAFTVDASQGLTVDGARLSFNAPSGLTAGADWTIQLNSPVSLPVLECTIAKHCEAAFIGAVSPVSAHTPP